MMESDTESFEVEEIRDKRSGKRGKGKIEYLIKWKGYAELENTWEPAENLQCFGMIAEFEERYKTEPTWYHSKYKKSTAKDEDGFDKSWTCVRIIGASQDEEGDILFLVQWETSKGEKSESFVLADKANKHIPKMVIEFYESKLTWHKQVPVK